MLCQFPLDLEKVIASIKLVLTDLGGHSGFHKLFKILYFSDQKHLVRYGRPINGDTYMAMKNGPVPSRVYDMVKLLRGESYFEEDPAIVKRVSEDFEVHGHHFLYLKDSSYDKDIFSDSEIECLVESIAENRSLSFNTLTQKSHDYAWSSADEMDRMSIVKIAEAAGANSELLHYIRLNLENQNFDL